MIASEIFLILIIVVAFFAGLFSFIVFGLFLGREIREREEKRRLRILNKLGGGEDVRIQIRNSLKHLDAEKEKIDEFTDFLVPLWNQRLRTILHDKYKKRELFSYLSHIKF